MLNSSVPTAKLKRLDRTPTGLNIYPRAPHLFIRSLSPCLGCHHPEFCICYSFEFSKEKKKFFFFKLLAPLIIIYLFIYLAVLGLRFCARASSSCGKRGPLFIAVRGPLTIAASLVAEHRLQTRRLSSCGSRAQLLRGMWDLPRPGLEPFSPALAGRLSTTAPPGKPLIFYLFYLFYFWLHWVFISVCGLLTSVASLVAEHGL